MWFYMARTGKSGGDALQTRRFSVCVRATAGVVESAKQERLFVRGRERIVLWRRFYRPVRRIWIEKRSERIGLAAIDETSEQKLVLETFGVARASQEREQAAHLRVGMNDDAIAPGDRRHDQPAKRGTVAIGRGVNRIKQFHAEHRAFRKPIEHAGSGCFHAGLELKIHDRAGRHAKRRNIAGSRRTSGLALRVECEESDGANKQRNETTHEEPLLMMKSCRKFPRLQGSTREVNREAANAWRNRRQVSKKF